MPRRTDGPLPENIPDRVLQNALPDRLQGILDRYTGDHSGLKDGGPAGQHGPLLGVLGDRPDKGVGDAAPRDPGSHVGIDHAGAVLGHLLDHVRNDDPQTAGKASPDANADALGSVLDVGPRQPNFSEDSYTRHIDHYNSQALSVHPDWFMI